MKSGSIAIIMIAVLLIIAQIISFCGMSRMYVGLYPDGDDLFNNSYTPETGLNMKKALFAITAGFDRFISGFSDLTYGEDEYRIMSANQMTSAMTRDSLGARSNKSFGLFVYDAILTIFYWFSGLLGIVLLVIGIKAKRKADGTNYGQYPETPNDGPESGDPSEPSWKRFL